MKELITIILILVSFFPISAEGNRRSPGIRDYVDFKTGEISQREYSPNMGKDYVINEYENGDVEVIVNGAYVLHANEFYDIIDEKDLIWRIPGTYLFVEVGYPMLSKIQFTIKKSIEPELNELYLAETDYRDYIVEYYGAEQGPQPDCIGCPDRELVEMTPYIGFWPENQFSVSPYSSPNENPNLLHIGVVPMQYNYETKTLRAYSRMLFKRGEPSGNVTIEKDNENATYYTIDGRPEPNPAKGGIYIRTDRNGQKKVIF